MMFRFFAFLLLPLLLLRSPPVLASLASSTDDESLVCGVTAYFNPVRYQTRLSNLVHARSWSRQQRFQLVIVELAYGDEPFETLSPTRSDAALVEDDDEGLTKYIRIRGNYSHHVLWQKEALLNIGIRHIPELFPRCQTIVWLDADVILEDGWVHAVRNMLNDTHRIGQAFTHLVRLPKGVFSPFSHWSEPRMKRMGFGHREGQVQFSATRKQGGHTGFAWVALASSLLQTNGLYPFAVVGGFDALLVHLFLDPRCETRFNKAMASHFDAWSGRALEIFRNVTHPVDKVKAATFWHGEVKDRSYQDRHSILLDHGFDPAKHVRLNENGLLEWTSETSCELRRKVFTMFIQRKEDGILSQRRDTMMINEDNELSNKDLSKKFVCTDAKTIEKAEL